LASSRDTSNGPDWQDVAQAILNYQSFWQGRAELVLSAVAGPKTGDLVIVARVLSGEVEGPAPSIWASASVSCRREGYKGLESAIMKALFDLDIALYRTNGPDSAN